MQMAAPTGKSWACAHVCGAPPKHPDIVPPHPPTPTPKGADPQNQSKVNKNLTNQDISILFEDFKFVEIPPPTHTNPHPPIPPTPIHNPRGVPLIC